MKKIFKLTPYTQILLSFAFIIIIGAFLLSLPISSVNNTGKSFIEALFTSTSAVCVTGLRVSDINTTYSVFGRTVIIILIQLQENQLKVVFILMKKILLELMIRITLIILI
jgi:trk system potassium uptake protein TrkH